MFESIEGDFAKCSDLGIFERLNDLYPISVGISMK